MLLPVNVAYRRPTTRSFLPTQYRTGFVLTDGNIVSCDQCINWWIDLVGTYNVVDVVITKKEGSSTQGLIGTEIHVGNSPSNYGQDNPRCAVISAFTATTMTFRCNMKGRYVSTHTPGTTELVVFVDAESGIKSYSYNFTDVEGRYVFVSVRGSNKTLALCDVKVYGMAIENVALKGVTARSSRDPEINDSVSWLIDTWPHTYVSTPGAYEWMRVDLQVPHIVTAIQVFLESDCCTMVEVRLGNSLENDGNNNTRCGSVMNGTGLVSCSGRQGRYVNLYSSTGGLKVSEVEVYGQKERFNYGLTHDYCYEAQCSRDIVVPAESLDWAQAREYCRQRYTDLVIINNAQDMNRVYDMMGGLDNHRAFWIGLSQGVPTWTWALWDEARYGAQTFRNWEGGEPVSQHGKYLCAAMATTGKWKGVECHVRNFFICHDGSPKVQQRLVLVARAMTFQQARDYCGAHHTDLALIRDATDNQEVQDMVPERTLVWIGLYAEPWAWVDRSASSFRYWLKTPSYWSLNATGLQHCVYMWKGMWSWRPCDVKAPFLCYSFKKKHMLRMQLESDLDLSDPIVQQLVLEKMKAQMKLKDISNFKIRWRRIEKAGAGEGGRQYHFYNSTLSWYDAQRFCRVKHSDLATAATAEEAAVLAQVAGKHDAWIGLRLDGPAKWLWSDGGGAPVATLWQVSEPNYNDGQETCVETNSEGWNDARCDWLRSFVCQMGKNYCLSQTHKILHVADESQAWIGLFLDRWAWSDGSPTSLRHWTVGRPANVHSCAYVSARAEGMWDEERCHVKMPFVCQGGLKSRATLIQLKMDSDGVLSDSATRTDLLQQMACVHPEFSSRVLREELTCPVCLDVYRDPRLLPCGHNFCLGCLRRLQRQTTTQRGHFHCPECRQSHRSSTTAKFQKNFKLANIADDFRRRLRAAALTCLKCEVSMCAEHVRPHLELPAFREHPLTDPLDDLRSRKCPNHDEIYRQMCRLERRYVSTEKKVLEQREKERQNRKFSEDTEECLGTLGEELKAKVDGFIYQLRGSVQGYTDANHRVIQKNLHRVGQDQARLQEVRCSMETLLLENDPFRFIQAYKPTRKQCCRQLRKSMFYPEYVDLETDALSDAISQEMMQFLEVQLQTLLFATLDHLGEHSGCVGASPENFDQTLGHSVPEAMSPLIRKPRKKRDKLQMKPIRVATDTEYGSLSVKVWGYDMTLVEHYTQYIHNLCNRLGVRVAESYALPTKATEVMLMQEQGTKMFVDALLKTHERIVQISSMNATLCPTFMDVVLQNQPEGVQLSVKEHTERDFQERFKARPQLEGLIAQVNQRD
ncbi:hypothetical protein NHX12_014026 [Muraenolepis orangiensis]|uniref:Large ribosomal subunit protein mL48 n=1 Tax=Muraenolepis orangiensis TaxID=630683 RepID=A0A9Q0DE46_9TELE|nr:hypothetical protein NHX12_014026 [Muraenolepis orangiensis]